MIEGLIRAALLLTTEVKKLIAENPPDVDIAETERLIVLVEDDLAYIRRWRERVRKG